MTTNLNVRTDKELKEAAEKLFEELGFNMTTAINMFLRQSVRENRLPFELTMNVPNSVTVTAIEEGRKFAADKRVKGYHSPDELKKAFEEI